MKISGWRMPISGRRTKRRWVNVFFFVLISFFFSLIESFISFFFFFFFFFFKCYLYIARFSFRCYLVLMPVLFPFFNFYFSLNDVCVFRFPVFYYLFFFIISFCLLLFIYPSEPYLCVFIRVLCVFIILFDFFIKQSSLPNYQDEFTEFNLSFPRDIFSFLFFFFLFFCTFSDRQRWITVYIL